jgi:O-acetyl-ADP-ribose deacetylase (regulator of RNase III)
MKTENRDITTVTKGLIVHGVNCQNAFNTGVAGAIKVKWPKVKESYHYIFDVGIDKLLGHAQFVKVDDDLWVGNLFTQEFFGYDGGRYADPSAIEQALRSALVYARNAGNIPLYMPRIGCKRGGLDWTTEVLPIVTKLECEFGVEITVCEYEET